MSASIPANSTDADIATLPSRHTGLLTVGVMGVSICQFLDMTIANVALPHMRASLGASIESISWVLTSFIIAGVVMLPLAGWMSERFGSRRLFLWATVGFILSSMLCGAATSLTQMVIFRALQGMTSAILGPMSQTMMYDLYPPSKQARAMAIWGMVVMVAPISGPFIGGYLTDSLNWRWVYYVNLPIGIPSLIIMWWLLPSRPITKRPLDVSGIVSLGIALGALQLALDRGQHKDWLHSWEIIIEFVLSASAFWIFFVHSSFARHPLFKRELMKNKNFLVALIFMSVLGIVNVALSSVLPTMYQTVYGYNVIDTGMLMAPRGIGVFCTMLLAARLTSKVDYRVMISGGYLIAAVAMWTMTKWSYDMDKMPIITSSFIQGLGLGLVFVPMNMAAFATLTPDERPDGSTLLTLFRNVGSSFGISIIVTILARNIQISHADIGASITSYNLPAIDPASMADRFGPTGAALLAMLDGEVNRQALMIAYLDNFYMLFWVILAFVPLAWFLRRPGHLSAKQLVSHK
jgi:MFS transporter, DHA2 family, multidrug resistance protein